MPHDRFYIDAPLEYKVTLDGEEFQHLSRVMRKKEGDTIELINGKHILALGTITHIGKKEGTISINEVIEKKPLLPPLILVQALTKLSNLEFIIQKGTELGVSTFHLYASTLSEKKELSNHQCHRLGQIMINATKQCGRLDLPLLSWGFPKLEGNVYFGDLRKNSPLLAQVGSLPATLIIGPEKGFTEEETSHLSNLAKGVRFTPYTLRAETAAIAGLSILAGNT